MRYQVLQDEKPCASYNIPSWNVDTFDTQKEAELFAVHWAYPIGKDQREEFYRPMQIDVPMDMGITEAAVWMKIIEVE